MTNEELHQLGAELERRRRSAGVSYNQLFRAVYDRIGAYAPTPETLRSYHHTAKRIDLVVLAAICDVYQCTLADVSERASEDAKRARDLLIERSGWSRPTLQHAC